VLIGGDLLDCYGEEGARGLGEVSRLGGKRYKWSFKVRGQAYIEFFYYCLWVSFQVFAIHTQYNNPLLGLEGCFAIFVFF
jgi:hypothetical protein